MPQTALLRRDFSHTVKHDPRDFPIGTIPIFFASWMAIASSFILIVSASPCMFAPVWNVNDETFRLAHCQLFALSHDEKMVEAYNSNDPYLTFAKQCGAVPADATKQSHPDERELYKSCVLAVQYGMGKQSLARNINKTEANAQLLLDQHRRTYKKFWEWSNAIVDFALINGYLQTALGWKIQVTEPINERSLRNFPMQANGAEILRLACILATEEKIKICAPVHDALLIEAPLDKLDHDIKKTQKCMQQAGEMILGGFKLRTDVKEIRWPNRYEDKRGIEMWNLINQVLADINGSQGENYGQK